MTITELLVRIGVDVKEAEQAQDKVEKLRKRTKDLGKTADRETNRFSRGLRKISQGAVSAGKKIAAFAAAAGPAIAAVAVAVGAAATATFRFVDSQTAALDQINKLAPSLGVGVEELQRLQFAGTQSGVATEKLSMAMKFFNKNLLDMAEGGGQLARSALERLGLNILDLEGKSRTEQIGLIGDRLQSVGNQAERAALSARIFGEEAGPALATLLAEGTRGIEALTSQAQGVFTQDEINRATKFQDSLGEVRNAVTGVVREVAVELLPTVQDAVHGFQEWFNANREIIAQDIGAFLKVTTDIMKGMVMTVSALADGITFLRDKLDALLNLVGTDSATAWDSFSRGVTSAVQRVAVLVGLMSELEAAKARLEGKEGARAGAGLSAKAGFTGMLVQERIDKATTLGVPIGGSLAGGTGRRIEEEARGGGGGGGDRGSGGPSLLNRFIQRIAEGRRGVTEQEALANILRRGGNDPGLLQRLQSMASATPSVKDIKPTTAIDVHIANFTFAAGAFDIKSTEPKAAGREVVAAMKREFSRQTGVAALALAGNVVR